MPYTQVGVGESASLDRFVGSNYEELKRWALQITSFDEALSGDILHDVYLKVRSQKSSAAAVNDPNGYLYVSLRNTFRSHLRSANSKIDALSFFDPAGQELSSLVVDPEPLKRAESELLSIGNYLCARKSKSIAASMAILKFFHAYTIDEISKVSNRSNNAIEARISKVRNELQDFIAGGELIVPTKHSGNVRNLQTKSHPDIFSEIRWCILQSASGRCINLADLKRLFRKDSGRPDREDLAHIVSCEKCLNLINEKLRLPKLSERHPLDNIYAKTNLEPSSSVWPAATG